jgi:hypothetical protein
VYALGHKGLSNISKVGGRGGSEDTYDFIKEDDKKQKIKKRKILKKGKKIKGKWKAKRMPEE